MQNETPFDAPISEQIWDMKYRFKANDGTPIDETVEGTWTRIAEALAIGENESVRDLWAGRFYDALSDWKYLPAGRIIAGAGTGRAVTLFNCLAADTMILTKEHGLVQIGEIAGMNVNVLDGKGEWVPAPINSFGEQPVANVVLTGGYNRRERKTIRATAGHRWIMSDGSEKTTNQLVSGDKLKFVRRKEVEDCQSYRLGVVHGLIYGDGSLEGTNSEGLRSFRIRLCGDKADLIEFFDSHPNISITEPPSFDGDPLVRLTGFRLDLKALPSPISHNVEYLTGFLRGWLAADGSVCARDMKAILSCGEDELVWLRKFGAISGMEVSFATAQPAKTNLGPRNKPLFNVGFHRWTMIEDDFLLAKHRANFVASEPGWEISEIGACEDSEQVYCPRVFSTDSVQLDLGIHTGNCYVMGTIPDSMDGIFSMLREAALTMQQGGGIGYDFSTLRPKGALVEKLGADASGPLTFMDCWDAMCRTVMSAGSRRGAMMGTMRCDHPDIEQFIEAKKDASRFRMFNLSVLVTDAFMEAVAEDADWRLHFENRRGETTVERTVKARYLWDKIMRSTYDSAEPGVIFIDRINQTNNLNYIEKIAATNPCGEQPLPPYGACLLGSINLARLIHNAYEKNAGLDHLKLEELVATAVRMMDNVIDVSNFPLPQQQEEARNKRRIGLGVTGLADALIMCGLRYGSPEAVSRTEKWLHIIAIAAYKASVELAKEKGAFPVFDADGYLAEGTFASTLPSELKDDIRKYGIRNSHLTSIAPTGTISLYAGNVSSGIEPIFAASYTRKVLQPDGSKTEERVTDYALTIWERHQAAKTRLTKEPSDPGLPPNFVTAQDLSPHDHLVMQAAAQTYIDSSISKTINLPEDIGFEDFEAVYTYAYYHGCKGCTTYRPNEITGSVLSVDEKPKEAPEDAYKAVADTIAEAALSERPETLPACVYKVKMGGDPAFYVTVSDITENGQRRPFEVFINTKNPEHIAWTTALTRTISAIFRRPHDSSFIVEELKNVFDPKGGGFWKNQYRPSVVAAIGQVIEDHMREIGYGNFGERKVSMPAVMAAPYGGTEVLKATCPQCFSTNMKHEAGCTQCLDCGHSKCG